MQSSVKPSLGVVFRGGCDDPSPATAANARDKISPLFLKCLTGLNSFKLTCTSFVLSRPVQLRIFMDLYMDVKAWGFLGRSGCLSLPDLYRCCSLV